MAQGLAASLEAYDSDLAAGVLRELRAGEHAHHVLTGARQQRIAQATQRIEMAGVDGIGQLTMRIDPHSYHYWGQRLGYECWRDKQFRDEFKRDNPEVRVRNRPRKETIIKPRAIQPATANRKPGTAPVIVAATKRGTVISVA